MTRKNIMVVHITIFLLALTIIIYPYIVPFFYRTIPFWGDPTERVTGVPSAFDGITGDVKRFNYSLFTLTPVTFINPSAFIVIYTAYLNLFYRPLVLVLFRKIKNHGRVLLIDLSINSLLAAVFVIRAITIWFQKYFI